jgi:hypothetical protein
MMTGGIQKTAICLSREFRIPYREKSGKPKEAKAPGWLEKRGAGNPRREGGHIFRFGDNLGVPLFKRLKR